MPRLDAAYTIPSAVMLGIALHDLATSMHILIAKISCRKTALWIISTITCLALVLYVAVQLALVDYIASPYLVQVTNATAPSGFTIAQEPFPFQWIGVLMGCVYILNFICGTGIVILSLVRLQLVRGNNIIHTMMIVLGTTSTVARAAACSLGSYMSFQLFKNGIIPSTGTTMYDLHLVLGAVDQLIEAMFLSTTSVLFVLQIGSGLSKTNAEWLRQIFLTHEGPRFLLIMVLNLICASLILGVVITGEYNNISHSALYLPSWTYALALNTFLQTSFVTASQVLVVKQETVGKQEPKDIMIDNYSERYSSVPRVLSRNYSVYPANPSRTGIYTNSQNSIGSEYRDDYRGSRGDFRDSAPAGYPLSIYSAANTPSTGQTFDTYKTFSYQSPRP